MRTKDRKEIEAKWKRLLSKVDTNKKADSPDRRNTTPSGTKVIRRRNGKKELVRP